MGRCEVWWARCTLAIPTGVLSQSEEARSTRFRQPVDAARSRVSAALVRWALGEWTGVSPAEVAVDRTCPGCGAEHGRPTLPGADVHVSVSHAGNAVAIAVADRPVGLDIEPWSAAERAWQVRETVCAPGEAVADPHTVLRYWVLKEAVLKCTGDGLLRPMTDIKLRPDDPTTVLFWEPHADLLPRLHVTELPAGGYARAIALLKNSAADPGVTITVRTVDQWGKLT